MKSKQHGRRDAQAESDSSTRSRPRKEGSSSSPSGPASGNKHAKKAKRRAASPAATLTRTFEFEADRHPVRVYLSRLGPNSARVMGAALGSIADILSGGKVAATELAWHELGPQHVSALRGRLQKLYAPSTANYYLAALRAVLKEAWRLGFIDREPMERALDVPPKAELLRRHLADKVSVSDLCNEHGLQPVFYGLAPAAAGQCAHRPRRGPPTSGAHQKRSVTFFAALSFAIVV